MWGVVFKNHDHINTIMSEAEFSPLEEYNGKLKLEFMGMKVTVKYVGSVAINKEQTIGKIGIAPEQRLKTTIFYSIDQGGKEIMTTSGENEGQSSTDKQDIVMLNSTASLEDIYQKHLSQIQGKTLKNLEKFAKNAKKIPDEMMKNFMKEMNEIGKGVQGLAEGVKDIFKDAQDGN